jgi:hypothetical protein
LPTFYTEQAFSLDPFAPPPGGAAVAVASVNIEDRNDNDVIGPATGPLSGRDQVNGSPVIAVYNGDTVTLRLADGSTRTWQGATIYTENGATWFTPTDGTALLPGTFIRASFVTDSTSVPVSAMFPPCFVAGTPIHTPDGSVPAERLRPGDRVMTLDRGAQRLVWVGQRTVAGTGRFAPVRFAPGALGNPQALEVSPQHRMLVTGWRAELLFGEPEVLVAAAHLVDGDRITRAPRDTVTYVHLMFAGHEIVLAAGVPSESFNPGAALLARDRALRDELAALFPDLPDPRQTGAPLHRPARPMPGGAEARALRRTA